MTVARCKIVNPEITPWYHCISHCVRKASLEKTAKRGDPKRWIQDRLEQLVDIFAIDVAGFSVMDNHFHVLAHLNVKASRQWTKHATLTRWAKLHPPRNARRKPLKNIKAWIREKQSDHKFVNNCRKRLVDLGWFMKSIKEPLARLINEADGEKGTFWSARYKSIAVLGESALLATCTYIDLNPLAAGVVKVPEAAMYTSIRLRVDACQKRGRIGDLKAARKGTALGILQAQDLEKGLWLCPIEDRRGRGEARVGLLEGMSLGTYLLLLDQTARMLRPGKATLSPDAEEILERLGASSQMWQQTITQLFARPRPVGVTFSLDRDQLREAAKSRGVHHVANLNGCPAKPPR
jgi:REP element-mobilizing transposase RayT